MAKIFSFPKNLLTDMYGEQDFPTEKKLNTALKHLTSKQMEYITQYYILHQSITGVAEHFHSTPKFFMQELDKIKTFLKAECDGEKDRSVRFVFAPNCRKCVWHRFVDEDHIYCPITSCKGKYR